MILNFQGCEELFLPSGLDVYAGESVSEVRRAGETGSETVVRGVVKNVDLDVVSSVHGLSSADNGSSCQDCEMSIRSMQSSRQSTECTSARIMTWAWTTMRSCSVTCVTRRKTTLMLDELDSVVSSVDIKGVDCQDCEVFARIEKELNIAGGAQMGKGRFRRGHERPGDHVRLGE